MGFAEAPERVLLSGYYGYGNLGDDALLQAVAEALVAAGCQRIAVPVGDPALLGDLPAEVVCLPRFAFGPMAAELRAGAVLLSGGGGLLQNVTSSRSLAYYLAVMELAFRLGRPVAVCGQSLGPLHGRLARHFTGRALRRAVVVGLRDQMSSELARAMGVPAPRRLVSPDPSFMLAEPAVGEVPWPQPILAVALRPTAHQERVADAVVEAWPRLPAAATRLLIACQEQDAEFAAEVAERLPEPPPVVCPRTPGELTGLLAGCDLVIAERLHALLLATAVATPAVGIAYDPKVTAAAIELGLRLAGRDADLTSVGLVATSAAAWEQRAEERERLAEVAEVCRQTAREGFAALLDALAAG